MATVAIPAKDILLHEKPEVTAALASIGIDYERWSLDRVGVDADAGAVLAAYAAEIEEMKSKGGYTTAGRHQRCPETPGLDAMLDRFKTEHTHDEDEVRFIIAGRGIFHIHPEGSDVLSIEVEAGDRFACHAVPAIGSTCAPIEEFARSAGSRTRRAGRRITRRAASIQTSSPSAFGPAYFGPRVETALQ